MSVISHQSRYLRMPIRKSYFECKMTVTLDKLAFKRTSLCKETSSKFEYRCTCKLRCNKTLVTPLIWKWNKTAFWKSLLTSRQTFCLQAILLAVSAKLAFLAQNITTCSRFLWLRSSLGLNPQLLTCSSCIDTGSAAGARMSSAQTGLQPMRSKCCNFLFSIPMVGLGSYSVKSVNALPDRLLIWIWWWLSQECLLPLSLRC